MNELLRFSTSWPRSNMSPCDAMKMSFPSSFDLTNFVKSKRMEWFSQTYVFVSIYFAKNTFESALGTRKNVWETSLLNFSQIWFANSILCKILADQIWMLKIVRTATVTYVSAVQIKFRTKPIRLVRSGSKRSTRSWEAKRWYQPSQPITFTILFRTMHANYCNRACRPRNHTWLLHLAKLKLWTARKTTWSDLRNHRFCLLRV